MLKLTNLSKRHKPLTTWPKEKKIQVVTQWLALGNLRLVAATTGISYGLIRQWKLQPWWAEFEREIRANENLQLDSSLTKIVQKSLEAVADRLEHGDHFYDAKVGKIKRKPVAMKDASKVATDLLTKRELLRGNATQRTEQQVVPVSEQLKLLAEQFVKMTKNPQEVIDVETVEIVNEDIDTATEMVQDIRDAYEIQPDDGSEEGIEDNDGGEGGSGADSGDESWEGSGMDESESKA